MIPERRSADTRVLVVDDNADNRHLIVTLLNYQGYQVFEAHDGKEGLDLAADVQPQLVISDILMPSMDGYEFVRQLRADPRLAGIEVIFYTAHYHEREAYKLAEACNVARVIVKPCEPADILNAVEEVLCGASPAMSATSVGAAFDHEHLNLITNKLSDKVDELHAVNARLKALNDLNLQLASEHDPFVLLEKVCYGARKLFGAKYAVLAVKQRNGANECFFTTSGMESPQSLPAPPEPQLDSGPLGRVFAGRRSWRANRGGEAALDTVLPADYPPAGAYVAVPVASLTHTYGWLCLADKVGADEFNVEDQRTLEILGAQVGRIYENGSLYQDVQMHAAQLQVEMDERERAGAALRQSEERFRQLAETIQDVFYIVSSDASEMIYLSPAYERIWGRDRNTDDPGDWLRSIHPDDVQRVLEQLKLNAGKSGNSELEYRIVRPDGSIRSILARQFPLCDAGGVPYRVVGIATDVTERVQAAAKIRHLNRVYAVLSGINSLIVRVQTRQELFSEACRIAVEHGDFPLAWIGSIDADKNEMTPVAWAGDSSQVAELARSQTPASLENSSLIAAAVHSRQTQICDDLHSVTGPILFRADLIGRGYQSLVVLPLVIQEKTTGCMCLASDQRGAFDSAELRLLTELAGDISFALDHIDKADRLSYLAYYDSLTGLANRTLFLERLAQYVGAAKHSKSRFMVVVADPERFDSFNETYGRKEGDELLKQLADRFTSFMGDATTVARVGPNNFAAVIPFAGDQDIVTRSFDEKYEMWLSAPFEIDGGKVMVAARVGIALFPNDGNDADALLKNAEAALKRAKAADDRIVYFKQEISEKIAERLSLETKLRRALDNQEFTLHYQPKIDLESRRIEGVEALIRWRSPELGLVPPLKFIGLLEETGLIVDVGAWVFRQACLDRNSWLKMGLNAPRIAVNVSPVQLRRADFVAVLGNALGVVAGMDTNVHGIDVEVTESLLLEGAEENIDKLRAIRAFGVGIALDDFGTGYSSLGYLAKLPVESLKIDRSFTQVMLDDPSITTLVSTIITLAHSMKLKVIAEGVELEEQAKILRLLRCDQMQGYLFSKPLPLEEMTALLTKLK